MELGWHLQVVGWFEVEFVGLTDICDNGLITAISSTSSHLYSSYNGLNPPESQISDYYFLPLVFLLCNERLISNSSIKIGIARLQE